MSKLKFTQEIIENLIQNPFPNAKIRNYKKFSTGRVSPTFKVGIKKPKKFLIIKFGKLKNKDKIQKNNKILTYLYEKEIIVPRVFFEGIFYGKLITIMECSSGEVASKIYGKANQILRKKILFNAGKNLKRIHELKIPLFWIHQHHEIKNQKEWKDWTRLRIDKDLRFFKHKLENYYEFLKKELDEFWEILKNEKIDFVPLHWDYHLSNLNSNSKGETTGIFDFDNAMKGHSLGEIGQTAYWITFEAKDYINFESFLKGYKNKFSEKELKLVRGYYLLHLLAVLRTIWFKRKDWKEQLINEHKKILDDFKRVNSSNSFLEKYLLICKHH